MPHTAELQKFWLTYTRLPSVMRKRRPENQRHVPEIDSIAAAAGKKAGIFFQRLSKCLKALPRGKRFTGSRANVDHMSKMLGKMMSYSEANVAATDFHRQNRLRTRKFSEQFSKQTGKFSSEKASRDSEMPTPLKSFNAWSVDVVVKIESSLHPSSQVPLRHPCAQSFHVNVRNATVNCRSLLREKFDGSESFLAAEERRFVAFWTFVGTSGMDAARNLGSG